MGVTVLFYKLFQFKDDLAAILKRYCCHGNVTYKFILTTVTTCSSIQIDLLNYSGGGYFASLRVCKLRVCELRVCELRVASLRVASLRVASLQVASLRVATEVLNCISSKKTNMESKLSRYTNENKQKTSTKEIYITNEIKT